VLVASTFGDYYNYRYAGRPRDGEPTIVVNRRDISLRSLSIMRASILAGFVVAISTVSGAMVVAWRALLQRNGATLAVLGASAAAVGGQLAFAVRWPHDEYGPIKGTYLQFASGPLFLVFGGVCSWLWRRPAWRPLVVLQLAAVGVLAAYSCFARWYGFTD
jgi:hypothetical protein